ncbi:MAG: ribonuclease III family protein [Candidatus Bathyarchaeales archaeon]
MKSEKVFSFLKSYKNLNEVLKDHKLASLGDAYVNFVYALALSNKRRVPSGAKVRGSILAEAIKQAALREFLPSRMERHLLADAAEALIVYAWLNNFVTLEEGVSILEKFDDAVEGFSHLLREIKNKIRFS